MKVRKQTNLNTFHSLQGEEKPGQQVFSGIIIAIIVFMED